MASTALLVMDVQQGIVDRFGGDEGYLPRLAAAVEAARGAGIWVIYVTVAFRAGHPEVSERNKSFAAIAGTGRFAAGDPGAAIHPAVAPISGDVIVTKRRVGVHGQRPGRGAAGRRHRQPGTGGHRHQRRGSFHAAPGRRP